MRNHLEPMPYYDTAGAAKMIARENPRAAGAIASSLCAELYDLKILKEGIEDGPLNTTRFLLLSRDGFNGRGDKTSVVFATRLRSVAPVCRSRDQPDANRFHAVAAGSGQLLLFSRLRG